MIRDPLLANLSTTAVTRTGTQTLTNKTLTAPTINESLLSSTRETLSIVSGTSPGGLLSPTLDAKTTSFYYYSSNTSANFAPNIRGNSSTTLASMLGNNEAITIALIVTNGATAYYCNGVRVDGSSPMVLKWQGGAAPTSGSANGLDLYTFTVMKFSGIFMVIAAQTKLG